MKIKNFTLIMFIFSYTFNSYAGDTIIGNGGDVLVCKNSKGNISKVLLYDYYEGKYEEG